MLKSFVKKELRLSKIKNIFFETNYFKLQNRLRYDYHYGNGHVAKLIK